MSYVPLEGTKVCRRCGETKDVHHFRVFRVYGAPDRAYRRSWCRACEREYARRWRRRNPGYHAEWSRRYRAMSLHGWWNAAGGGETPSVVSSPHGCRPRPSRP